MHHFLINRSHGKITGQIPVDISKEAEFTVYCDKTEISKESANLDHGFFEINDEFEEPQIFVKVDDYVGFTHHFKLASLYNLRDLGGYQGKYGIINCRLLYRSDALDHLNPADQQFLTDLSIDTVIDLRSAKEINQKPDLTIGENKYIAIDPAAEVAAEASKIPNGKNHDQQKVIAFEKLAQSEAGRKKLQEMQQQMNKQMHDMVAKPVSQQAYSEFLHVVLKSPGAVLYHCQGGKDRTGWATVLLLGLLGVDEETIMEDYLLTKTYNEPRNAKRMEIYKQYTDNKFVLDYLHSLQLAKTEYLNSALDTMHEISSSYEDYVNRYLNFNSEDIQRLRQKYLK